MTTNKIIFIWKSPQPWIYASGEYHLLSFSPGPCCIRPFKRGSAASFLPPLNSELHKHISVESLHTDRITTIVGIRTAPSLLSLQSSLSTICTKPFGDFEFGCFTSVTFSPQTFFFLLSWKNPKDIPVIVRKQRHIVNGRLYRKGSLSDCTQMIFGSR